MKIVLKSSLEAMSVPKCLQTSWKKKLEMSVAGQALIKEARLNQSRVEEDAKLLKRTHVEIAAAE